jgi:ATP-dependent Clp protease ATP-binding subunit ClpC
VTLGQLPLSQRATRAIELADEAASRLSRGGIGTEHLLLGLLKVKKGIAAQALTHLGLEPDEVRDMVLEVVAALYRQNRLRLTAGGPSAGVGAAGGALVGS